MFPFGFISGGGAASIIVNAFKARVEAAGGTFEAANCMQTTITDLQNININ
jgi:hypothetical protein